MLYARLTNAFFDGVIYINSGTKKPLQTYLQSLVIDQSQFMNMTAEERQRLEELTSKNFNAAKLLVSMIPILAVYPFLQRFFDTGLVLGSVKSKTGMLGDAIMKVRSRGANP